MFQDLEITTLTLTRIQFTNIVFQIYSFYTVWDSYQQYQFLNKPISVACTGGVPKWVIYHRSISIDTWSVCDDTSGNCIILTASVMAPPVHINIKFVSEV